MSSGPDQHDRNYLELVFVHALQAVPPNEIQGLEAHLSACPDCRKEMETLRPIIGAFVSWLTDVLRPSVSLWQRLAERIAAETGQELVAGEAETLSAYLDWYLAQQPDVPAGQILVLANRRRLEYLLRELLTPT